MKPLIIFFGILLITFTTDSSAQVGIKTTSSLGVFHLDGAGDNDPSESPTSLQQVNDVFVSESGRLGLGTINPQNHLHIVSPEVNKSNLRLTRITNSTPIVSGNISLLAVDKNGDVVTAHRLTSDGSLSCVPSVLLNRGSGNSIAITAENTILTRINTSTVMGSQNNISYNPNNGSYTLQPGHTYKLEAAVSILPTNNDHLKVFFTLASNTTTLGNLGRSTPATASGSSSDGDQGKAVTIVNIPEGSSAVSIVLRASPSSSSVSYSPINSFVSIQQMDPCSSN